MSESAARSFVGPGGGLKHLSEWRFTVGYHDESHAAVDNYGNRSAPRFVNAEGHPVDRYGRPLTESELKVREERHRQRLMRAAAAVPPWEADAFARWGADEPPVGTVIRYAAKEGDSPVLALRTATGWSCQPTAGGSSHGSNGLDWVTVVRLIGDSTAHVAREWVEVPRPAPAPSGDEAVKEWASQFLPSAGAIDVELSEGIAKTDLDGTVDPRDGA